MGALWGEIWLGKFALQRTGHGAGTDGGHILASPFTPETLKLSGGLSPLRMLSG